MQTAPTLDIDAALARLQPIIRRLVRRHLRFWPPALRLERSPEIEQAALISAWKALEDYDPARGSVESFALKPIRWGIIDAIRTIKSQRRAQCIQLDDMTADALPDRGGTTISIEELADNLPPNQKRLLHLLLTRSDVAAELGVSVDIATKRINRLRQRICEEQE